ncbi:MAG: polysaccharide deacetylase family protein [Gemmatimonadota bacterium]|nr:polysaccharide deacetylase family protein [Gemmatimonadota bacterium]
MTTVSVTVDVEPDCPPYLWSWRGLEEGMPLLLDLLDGAGISGTFFTTGESARRYPAVVRRIVEGGHELACHGMTHRAFTDLSLQEAREEVALSSEILRDHAPVDSFRAPYLRFPDRYLPLLEEYGFRVDSSRGLYKPAHWRPSAPTALTRIPASMTSSVLRLSPALRDPVLRALHSPVVLFVHPWEFVDLRDTDLRWDCRWGTGPHALASLASTIDLFRRRGDVFRTVREVALHA